MTTEAPADGTAAATARHVPWGIALAAIVGAEFMLQLDGTIINVAMPALRADLHLTVPAGSWVLNGFFVAFGGLLLLSGRLGDVLGHWRVFLAGVGLVTVASLLAGLAPDYPVLIAGRVLQGGGAALAGPAGLALLAITFQGERQQRAFGLYSTVTGLGASAGLVLGGLLTWSGDWRLCLLINAPIGAAIIVFALLAGDPGATASRGQSLGAPRAALFTVALTGGIYGLVSSSENGWSYIWTVVPVAVAVVALALALVLDSRAGRPLLPGRIFASRARAGAFISLLLLACVLTGFLFFTAQYLHAVLGYDELETGLAVLPFALALLIATQLLTKQVSRVPLPARGVAGLALVVAGLAWLATINSHTTYAAGVLPQIVILGLGVGLAIVPFNMIVLTTVNPEDAGVTAGILQAALTVGGALGLAVLLIPFSAGHVGVTADGTSRVFIWGVVIAAVALALSLVLWFGPGTRKPAAPQGRESAEQGALSSTEGNERLPEAPRAICRSPGAAAQARRWPPELRRHPPGGEGRVRVPGHRGLAGGHSAQRRGGHRHLVRSLRHQGGADRGGRPRGT
jgi:EmrB/QacA subfamily drug resistance transporter